MNPKRRAAREAALRRRGGLLARIRLKIRWLLSRLTGRKTKKNPNIYPLY